MSGPGSDVEYGSGLGSGLVSGAGSAANFANFTGSGLGISAGTHPSTSSLRTLAKGRPAVNGASTASVVGLGMTPGGASTGTSANLPQTGASKMAAAAKRGQQVGGKDNLPPVNSEGQEDEDHPLSEKALRSRYVSAALFGSIQIENSQAVVTRLSIHRTDCSTCRSAGS